MIRATSLDVRAHRAATTADASTSIAGPASGHDVVPSIAPAVVTAHREPVDLETRTHAFPAPVTGNHPTVAEHARQPLATHTAVVGVAAKVDVVVTDGHQGSSDGISGAAAALNPNDPIRSAFRNAHW